MISIRDRFRDKSKRKEKNAESLERKEKGRKRLGKLTEARVGASGGCKSPRDHSAHRSFVPSFLRSSVHRHAVRSDITKNHGAAFRPDIFQLPVNMIGGGRSCKSPTRRCPQHARTHLATRVINRRQPQTMPRYETHKLRGQNRPTLVDTSIPEFNADNTVQRPPIS